ncbi:hypothetical protein AMTRI_Chr04g184650 [Amborella trichopoda]
MFWSHNASVVEKGGPTVHVLESQRSSSCKRRSDSTCSGVTSLQKFQSAVRQYIFWSHNAPTVAKGGLAVKLRSHWAPAIEKGGSIIHVLESQHVGSCKGWTGSTTFVSHNAPTVVKGGLVVHVLESQRSGSCKA